MLVGLRPSEPCPTEITVGEFYAIPDLGRLFSCSNINDEAWRKDDGYEKVVDCLCFNSFTRFGRMHIMVDAETG